MKTSPLLNILRIFITFIWRLALTAVTVAALCVIGGGMVLSLIFNGPSETARDRLTLTLMEAELTRNIPAWFLTDSCIDQILTGQVSMAGHSDPSLITPVTDSAVRATTLTTSTYSAQIMLLPADSGLRFAVSADAVTDAAAGDRIILSPAIPGAQNCACFLEDGILFLSDGPLEQLGIDRATIADCGPVLILNGRANETLFSAGSGYAPRVAIGQAADGTVIFVTTDGWTQEHVGATFRDIANIMKEFGAINACLLSSDAACTVWLVDTNEE